MENNASIMELLENWDIGRVQSANKIYYTGAVHLVHTASGRKYILKEKKDADKISSELLLLRSLKACSLPVGVPVQSLGGSYCLEKDSKHYCLYPYLPGNSVSHYYLDGAERRAEAFGRTIGLLHAGLKSSDAVEGFHRMDLLDEISGDAAPRIRQNSSEEDKRYTDEILEKIKEGLEPLLERLPVQLIHKDIHPSNMLFQNGKLTGIIDFESVERGIRVFDVCYCAAYILIGGFKEEERKQRWFGLLKALLEGYSSIIRMSRAERTAFWCVLMATLFIFTAAFFKVWNMDLARKTQQVLFWCYENRDAIMKTAAG